MSDAGDWEETEEDISRKWNADEAGCENDLVIEENPTDQKTRTKENWAMLSDEQMSNGYPFSLLNDEQMSNKVRVEHQPEKRDPVQRGNSRLGGNHENFQVSC